MIETKPPENFLRRLKNFDRFLDVESRGPVGSPVAHWCIIDKSKILNVVKETIAQGYVVRAGKRIRVEVSRPIVRYDVVMHLPADRSLSTSIIDDLNYRRMDRWARKKDYLLHMEKQLDAGEAAKKKELDDFAAVPANELKGIMGNPETVTIDGRRDLCH